MARLIASIRLDECSRIRTVHCSIGVPAERDRSDHVVFEGRRGSTIAVRPQPWVALSLADQMMLSAHDSGIAASRGVGHAVVAGMAIELCECWLGG